MPDQKVDDLGDRMHSTLLDRSTGADQYVWLFDERFDFLCRSFQEFLSSRGIPNAKPIFGYKMFPAITEACDDSKVAEMRQRSPDRINRSFLELWDRSHVSPKGSRAIPTVSFTMEGLADRPGLDFFGPSPRLAEELNDKISQYSWLQDAGLPLPPFVVADGFDDLYQCLDTLLATHLALFVQPRHSSGGESAGVIRSFKDFELYRKHRMEAGTPDSGLVVTRFLTGATSLSGHGLVTRQGKVLSLAVNELLLDGFRFDGFIFPVMEDPAVENEVLDLTGRVGEILAAKGYWGYFAADFLYRADAFLVLNEINVRFAGEAAFLAAYMTDNLFSLLNGQAPTGPGPLISQQEARVVVTKIRPRSGFAYPPVKPEGTIPAFLSGSEDEFRIRFHDVPIRVVDGHFIGLAGRRFSLQEDREVLLSFYLEARNPTAAVCFSVVPAEIGDVGQGASI